MPPGLRSLTAAQTALVDFLCLDGDLLEAAAVASTDAAAGYVDRRALEEWIRDLPAARKDELLLQHVLGEEPLLRSRLQREFRQARPRPRKGGHPALRSVQDLLVAAEDRAETRTRKEAAAREATRHARAEEEARRRAEHLDRVATRVEETWQQIEGLIQSRKPAEYDRAVTLLTDLRDLAAERGGNEVYGQRLRILWDRHAKKGTLIRRLRDARLLSA